MNKIPSVEQLIFDVYTICNTTKTVAKSITQLRNRILKKHHINDDIKYYSCYQYISNDTEDPYCELIYDIILWIKLMLEDLKLTYKISYDPNYTAETFTLNFFRKNEYYTFFLIRIAQSYLNDYTYKHNVTSIDLYTKTIDYDFRCFSSLFLDKQPNLLNIEKSIPTIQLNPFFTGIKEDLMKIVHFKVLEQPTLNTTEPQIKEVIKEVEKIVEVEKQISPKQSNVDIKEQLLKQLKQLTPTQFEHFALYLISVITGEKERNIKDLVIHNGQVGDGGVDGVFEMKNKFGTYDTYVIQCKRYDKASIGRPELQNFVGAMALYQTKQGLFITTSKFSKNVFDYIENVKHTYSILTMDGMKLVEYMIEHNIGVYDVTHIEKVIDTNFFDECKYQIS